MLEGADNFVRDCEQAARNVEALAWAVTAKLTLELLIRLIEKTPVDRGRARGNWQVTQNAPANGVVGFWGENGLGSIEDAGARATRFALDNGQAAIATAAPFADIYVANNVEYVEVLEFGTFEPADPGPSKDPRPSRTGRILVEGGFSVQSPQGMLGISLVEIQSWWDENADKFGEVLALRA